VVVFTTEGPKEVKTPTELLGVVQRLGEAGRPEGTPAGAEIQLLG
jgi:hypothetical protein